MKRVPKELSEKFFDDEKLLPGFGGIGSLRGNPLGYSNAEKIVLNHFFTNTHSNIYAAKDNLSNGLWTQLMGQYARSNLTARDRLLKIFRDVKEKYKDALSTEDLADEISSHEDITQFLELHLREAEKFVEDFGIDYGHASMRDSGTIRMCFEGISQRATKFLESAREGAYQEQSTRALPFEENWLGMPFEIRGTEFEIEMSQLNQKTIQFYNNLRTTLPDFLKAKNKEFLKKADDTVKSELGSSYEFPRRKWESVIGARVFDIVRFLLPQNMTTSLGMTLNARRFQDQLTEWQSLPSWEMQLIGRAAQIEAMKIHPTLMKYGNPSEFYQDLPRRRKELFDEFASYGEGKSLIFFGNQNPSSQIINFTPDIENLVLASVLLNGSGERSFEELVGIVKGLNHNERKEIAQNLFKDKKSYEINAKDMEVGSFTFERLYDIGAFRDLQRQRGDRQQIIPYTAKIGYTMPPEIAEVGLENEFREILEDVKSFYEKLENGGMRSVAEYVPLMANLIRHVTTKDPVQCFYEAKLRTQPAGNDTYRDVAQQEIKQVLEAMPSFKGLVDWDENYYPLNRLPESVNGYIKSEKNKLS